MDNLLKKLQIPAILLGLFGFLNGLSGFIILISTLLRLSSNQEFVPINEAERMGYVFAGVVTTVIALISILVAPVIIFGAIQMINGKRALLVKVSAILAMLPFTACCFLFGIPIGAWTLYILTRPEIKNVFDGTQFPTNNNTPQTPSF